MWTNFDEISAATGIRITMRIKGFLKEFFHCGTRPIVKCTDGRFDNLGGGLWSSSVSILI